MSADRSMKKASVFFKRLTAMAMATMASVLAFAEGEGDEAEPVQLINVVEEGIGLPQPDPVEGDDFSAIKNGSPFVRVLDPGEKYVLRAVAAFDDIQIATLQDRQTKETFLVTPEEVSEEGLQLVEVVPGEDLEGVAVKITFAGQEVEFKYETSQLFPRGVSPGSSGGGDKKDEKRKGPSKEDIARYKSLSDEQRNKLRSYIGHVMKTYPNLSRDERGNMIRGAMTKLADGRELDFKAPDQNRR